MRDDELREAMVADRRRAQAVIDIHRPVRSWRSLGRTRCSACALRWETDGQLVGCLPVMEATAELAGLPGHGRHEYTGLWPR